MLGPYSSVMNLQKLLERCRILIAEKVLPPNYYVQQLPFECYAKGQFPDFAQEVELLNDRQDKSPREGVRWLIFRLLLEHVKKCAPGDYAELGTYRGKTARIIYRDLPASSQLYCFDTFEGFHVDDVQREQEVSGLKVAVGGYGDTSLDGVLQYIADGNKPGNVVMRAGFFPDTFKGLEDNAWRFVHIDCDLAEPLRSALDLFWPKLCPGGVILIHDFNGYYAEGIRQILSEFGARSGAVAIPLPDGCGSAVIAKGWK